MVWRMVQYPFGLLTVLLAVVSGAALLHAAPGVDADGTYNRNLLNGYMNSNTAAALVISEIPYASYDLYVRSVRHPRCLLKRGSECDENVTCTVSRSLIFFVREPGRGKDRRKETLQLETAG